MPKSKNNEFPKITLKLLFISFFYFSLFTFDVDAQSITWQRTYDGGYAAEAGFDVCKADGDNIYIVGFTTIPPNFNRIYLLKLNAYGDTIWTRKLGDNSFGGPTGNSIVSDGSGGCVITGVAGYAFTIKLDLNGNIVWYKNYGGFFKQCYDMVKTSDEGYIVCGRDAEGVNDDAYVFKIDSLGNLQWQKTYYSSNWKNFECIIESNNNDGYITGGFNYDYPSDTLRGVIFKINTNGDSIYEKRYNNQLPYTIKSTGNGYLLSGRNAGGIFIERINESGDTTFMKTINGTNVIYRFGKLEIINPNKYVIAATRDPANLSYGHAIVTDSSGNIILEKLFQSPDFLLLESVLPMPNGDIVFTGQVDFDSVLYKEDVYVLRTDSLLNAPPLIGINRLNQSIAKDFKLYQNYPNPFNPVTTIKYDIPVNGQITLKIYDITGREVFSINEYRHAGSYSVTFDGTNFASGIYLYQLNAGNYTGTKKMVLIK